MEINFIGKRCLRLALFGPSLSVVWPGVWGNAVKLMRIISHVKEPPVWAKRLTLKIYGVMTHILSMVPSCQKTRAKKANSCSTEQKKKLV